MGKSKDEDEEIEEENEEEIEEEIVEEKVKLVECSNGKYIFSIFHSIMIFIAVYLSFKCREDQDKFNIIHFIIAILCPQFYIIYILATKGLCDGTGTGGQDVERN